MRSRDIFIVVLKSFILRSWVWLKVNSTSTVLHKSMEEEYWALKSRLNASTFGDRNTNFFHVSTLVRRHRNKSVVYVMFLHSILTPCSKNCLGDSLCGGCFDM
ncbi:hypothetical protein CFP56_023007 [Quercus suber]|uniref:Uncharacterized protein n=1 Tax=Quercus suber TaxID=58331 RepID=A0AAW0KAJ3_QUESU